MVGSTILKIRKKSSKTSSFKQTLYYLNVAFNKIFFVKIKNPIYQIYFIDIKAKKMPKKNLTTDNL